MKKYIFKEKEINIYELNELFEDYTNGNKIPNYTYEKLTDMVDNGDIKITITDYDEVESSLLWRLTSPIYFIYILFLHIFLSPVNYLITGEHIIRNGNNNFMKFKKKWYNKL